MTKKYNDNTYNISKDRNNYSKYDWVSRKLKQKIKSQIPRKKYFSLERTEERVVNYQRNKKTISSRIIYYLTYPVLPIAGIRIYPKATRKKNYSFKQKTI